jgi:hypothetical protein
MSGRALLTALVSALFFSAGLAAAAPSAPDLDSQPGTRDAPTLPTPLRVRGTIARYDADAGLLVLTTSTGPVRFSVGSKARVRVDGHRVSAEVLRDLAGRRAAVRYAEADGRTTVESVSVSRTGGRTAR